MKKLLLLSLTLLCAVSLSAATQTVRIKNAQSNLVQKATTTFSLNKNAQCASFMAQPINSPRLAASKTAAKRVVRHLPGVADLRGSYVEDTPGTNDGIEYATACTSVEIRDTLVVDEETGEEYNVYIEGFCQGIASVIGQYDPEDGTILIPMQYCYYDEEDEQVQLAHIAAFTEVTAEGYNLADYLVLLVSEDENGFYVELDKDSELGWCVICDEGDPNFAGFIIALGEDLVLNPANYHMIYQTYNLNLPKEEQSWERNDCSIFVEDLGDELLVHGFCGSFCNSLTVKGEGELTFRTGQNVHYSSRDGAWLGFYTFDDEGWFLCSDTYECPIVVGESGTIYYGDVNEEDKINWDYLCLGYYDKTDPESGGLWTGIEFAGIQMQPMEYYLEGVGTVLSPVATSKAAFNLQGQRVNTPGKGINLWNGKKYIVK